MKEQYLRQARLMLEVLRIAAESKVFALKGGTAINFFFQNCPRFSVDIDLHYLPLNERDEAFSDIRRNLKVIESGIKESLSGAEVNIASDCKASVKNKGMLVKIEVNQVIRGTLLPTVERPLCPLLEREFGEGMAVDCVAQAELYAGKFCAALQRQHPRDIFDVWLFFERESELTQKILDAFVIYLISHRKPIHEVLNPRIKDIRNLYDNHFEGMARTEVSLEDLLETQRLFPAKILSSLTERHRNFLVGFSKGEPDWSLLPFTDVKNLPAVRWKQINLDKMDSAKREETTRSLLRVLEDNPYRTTGEKEEIVKDMTKKPEPKERLSQEIVDELIAGKLISEARGEKLQRQIADGTLKREDWLLLVDIGTGLEEGEGNG